MSTNKTTLCLRSHSDKKLTSIFLQQTKLGCPPPAQSSLTKQHFAHCGANPNHFPQHQVVLIDWGPTPPLGKTLRQRKLARLRAFIACELYRTESCGPSNAGAGLCSGSLSGPVCCTETAAAPCTAPSKETIRNTLFLLLPTINHHCVELVAAYGISGF